MAVINTNIMALIGQQNLRKSQNQLQTAMERLSSGLRINSAADDAAGEAIANRMTSQVNGLQQASRNANDGISVAQTTEGALDQINNDLQRVRQLSVEAANGTYTQENRQSIQDEINQQLDEINRISSQTSFNGVSVLSKNQTLNIQVGANDGQTIQMNLSKIDKGTLGLSNFSIVNSFASKGLSSTTLTAVGMTSVSNTITAAVPATSVALSFHTTAATYTPTLGTDGKLYVKASSKYYAATFNQSTGTLTFDGGTSVAAPGGVVASPSTFIDGSGNVVQWSTITGATQDNTAAGSTAYTVNQTASGKLFAKSAAGSTFTLTITTNASGSAAANTINLSTGYVKLGTKDATAATGVNVTSASGVLHTPGMAAVSLNMSAVNASLSGATNKLVQNSAGAYFVKSVKTGSAAGTTYYAATLNSTTGDVTLGAALVSGSNSTQLVKAGNGDYFVKSTGSAGTTYYGATVGSTGAVTVGSAVGSAGDTLMQNSTGQIFVQHTSVTPATSTASAVTNVTYYATSVSSTGMVSQGAQATVDPLAMLSKAISQVDNLRSNLGAYQNRLQGAIENLGSTTTNLSAARSRIQDADYATEVSAMTRAQILQQAGTSVLAQANKTPQTVLTLLRG